MEEQLRNLRNEVRDASMCVARRYQRIKVFEDVEANAGREHAKKDMFRNMVRCVQHVH